LCQTYKVKVELHRVFVTSTEKFLLYRTSPTFHGKEVTSFELFIKNVFSWNTNVWGNNCFNCVNFLWCSSVSQLPYNLGLPFFVKCGEWLLFNTNSAIFQLNHVARTS